MGMRHGLRWRIPFFNSFPAVTGAPNKPLDGETLSITTGELFVAPLESNFKLSDHEDTKVLKNIGDPRWY